MPLMYRTKEEATATARRMNESLPHYAPFVIIEWLDGWSFCPKSLAEATEMKFEELPKIVDNPNREV